LASTSDFAAEDCEEACAMSGGFAACGAWDVNSRPRGQHRGRMPRT